MRRQLQQKMCAELGMKQADLNAAIEVAQELKGKLADDEIAHALDPSKKSKLSRGTANHKLVKVLQEKIGLE